MGVNADGGRDLFSFMVGDSKSEGLCSQFNGSLKECGLSGVNPVISNAQSDLITAIRLMLHDTCWQRRRMLFAINLFKTVPKAQQEMVAASLHSVFALHSKEAVLDQ